MLSWFREDGSPVTEGKWKTHRSKKSISSDIGSIKETEATMDDNDNDNNKSSNRTSSKSQSNFDASPTEEVDVEWKTILTNVERQLADLDATSVSSNTSAGAAKLDELLSNVAYWEGQRTVSQGSRSSSKAVAGLSRARSAGTGRIASSTTATSSPLPNKQRSHRSASLPTVPDVPTMKSLLLERATSEESTEEEDGRGEEEKGRNVIADPIVLEPETWNTPAHWFSQSIRVMDEIEATDDLHSGMVNAMENEFDLQSVTAPLFHTTPTGDDSNSAIPTLITCQASHPVQQEELLPNSDPVELIRYSYSPEQQKRVASLCCNVSGELQAHAQAFDALMTAHLEAAKQQQRTGTPATAATLDEHEQAVLQFMHEYPMVLQVQYHFSQLETSCWPLHYFAATSCLWPCQMCHMYFAEAIGMADTAGDLPLHYACYMQAQLEVIEYLVRQYPQACSQTNDLLQTPLHSVVLVESPPIQLLQYLLDTYPLAASLRDADGNTPLHLLLPHSPNLEYVQLLVLTAPQSLQLVNSHGDGALHAACRYGLESSVVTWLLQHEPEALLRQNQQGHTPLHNAVSQKHWHLIPTLVIGPNNPDSLAAAASPLAMLEADALEKLKRERSYAKNLTPYDMAVKLKAPRTVLELLTCRDAVPPSGSFEI